MLEELKQEVYRANVELVEKKLVIYTWGNASAIDRDRKFVVIKPSGVNYDELRPSDMVVLSIDGEKIEGRFNPSSDTATHLELYKKYTNIGGIVHTHSTTAAAWAQAGRAIPIYGTTHADYFFGDIPCARGVKKEELTEYEKNTGKVIIEKLDELKINPIDVPGILCKNHGPFTWGKNVKEAVYNAVTLEEIARIALKTEQINSSVMCIPDYIRDKHFFRKHGADAYYGQTKND